MLVIPDPRNSCAGFVLIHKDSSEEFTVSTIQQSKTAWQ